MPTKVSIPAAQADEDSCQWDDETTIASKKSYESEVVDTSMNMLLHDTIDSDSESESEIVNDSVASKRMAMKLNSSSTMDVSKNSGDTSKTSIKVQPKSSHTGIVTNGTSQRKPMAANASFSRTTTMKHRRNSDDKDNSDDEPNWSDTDASFDAQPSSSRRSPPNVNNNCEDKKPSDSASRSLASPLNNKSGRYEKGSDNDETRLSDQDSFLQSPPRQLDNEPGRNERARDIANLSQHDNENDETRISDQDSFLYSQRINQPSTHENRRVLGGTSGFDTDNDETKLSISLQEPPSPRPVPKSSIHQKDEPDPASREVSKPRPRQKFEWPHQKQCDEFRLKFKQTVSNFENCYPKAKLRDYQDMTAEEQIKEQQNVISLLDRLGIRSKDPGGPNESRIDQDATIAVDQDMSTTRIDSPINTRTSTLSDARTQSQRCGDKKVATLRSPELSPIANHHSPESVHGGRFSPASFDQEAPCFSAKDSASEMSVEITRGADESPLYQSPPLRSSHPSHAAKRLATTSGRRGQDCSRVRLSLSPPCDANGSDSESMPNPAPSWHSSDDSMSIVSSRDNEDNPFAASLSPIAGNTSRQNHLHRSPRCSRQNDRYYDDSYSYDERSPVSKASHRREERSPSKRSSRNHQYSSTKPHSNERESQREKHQRRRHDDTIDTVNATTFRGPHDHARFRGTTNIRLKENVPFHYNPLVIKGSKRRSHKDRGTERPLYQAVDFRDPLGETGSQSELYSVYEWMVERNSSGSSRRGKGKNTDAKGIIFSLEAEQIVNVTIKFLMACDQHGRQERYSEGPSLTGETLIIVRSKDDVALWERAFREHTPFSMINHASLTSGERQRTGMASTCTTYDVVVSTYDALKAQETTVQLDDEGYVTFAQVAESQSLGGWMTKRSLSSNGESQRMGGFSQPVASAARCKQLSALHSVQWRRIIFIDDLGRKSYLAKRDTARFKAAVAVNAEARYAFFTREEENDSSKTAFESLLKSDRRAITSVASVLRVDINDEEDDEDDFLLDIILDPCQGI